MFRLTRRYNSRCGTQVDVGKKKGPSHWGGCSPNLPEHRFSAFSPGLGTEPYLRGDNESHPSPAISMRYNFAQDWAIKRAWCCDSALVNCDVMPSESTKVTIERALQPLQYSAQVGTALG